MEGFLKKILVLLSCLLVAFIPFHHAKADDMFEEEETCTDAYYLSHKEECKEDNRTFITTKEVPRYKNPESEQELKKLPAGKLVNIQMTYQTRFETWGLLFWSFDTDGNVSQTSGWVKLSDLKFIYDARAFYYDHEKELIRDRDTLSFDTVRKQIGNKTVVWSYPCSGKVVSTLSKEYYPTDVQIQTLPLYQDPSGRYWLMISGREYIKNGKYSSCAICLSEPENLQIQKEQLVPYTEPETGGSMNTKIILLAGGGIFLLCILIARFIITKKHKKGN